MPAQDSELLRRDLSHRGDRFPLQHPYVVADIRAIALLDSDNVHFSSMSIVPSEVS